MVLLLSAFVLATSLTFFVSPATVQHKRDIDAVHNSMISLGSDSTDLLENIQKIPLTGTPSISDLVAAAMSGLSTYETATTLESNIGSITEPITDPSDVTTITQQLTNFHSTALQGIEAFAARKDLVEKFAPGSGVAVLSFFQTLANNLFSAAQKIGTPSGQTMLTTYKQDIDQAFAKAFNTFPSCDSGISLGL